MVERSGDSPLPQKSIEDNEGDFDMSPEEIDDLHRFLLDGDYDPKSRALIELAISNSRHRRDFPPLQRGDSPKKKV